MNVLRTPEERFKDIPDFPYQPKYLEVVDEKIGALRVAYIDEGDANQPVVLCMHGEPTWSFLYRKMIPVFLSAGYRVIAPDLIGFGRSDKPTDRDAYSVANYVKWMSDWLNSLELNEITLVAQDWGGHIGLRLLTAMPEKFSRVSISNTGLQTGDEPMSDFFMGWRELSQTVEDFDIGLIVNMFDEGPLTEAEKDAYRAPFPSEEYKAGARQFPLLIPVSPDDPASEDNRNAWKVLEKWEKPMLLCFSDNDPLTGPCIEPFKNKVPGAKGQPHVTLNGLHFIQEQQGERWAQLVIDWANQ